VIIAKHDHIIFRIGYPNNDAIHIKDLIVTGVQNFVVLRIPDGVQIRPIFLL
jgi:hypothetical protein